MSSKKVIITGAGGFLGSRLASFLEAKGYDVTPSAASENSESIFRTTL